MTTGIGEKRVKAERPANAIPELGEFTNIVLLPTNFKTKISFPECSTEKQFQVRAMCPLDT